MQETIEFIKQAFDLKSQKCYKQAIEMLYKALELENEKLALLRDTLLPKLMNGEIDVSKVKI